MKTLIVLGAGTECIDNIRHAKELGYKVIVLDYNPDAPGIPLADEYLPLNPYDAEESASGIAKWLKAGNSADGVICVALDAPHTVAAIEQTLGKVHLSKESARLATDKVAMKERLSSAGIAVPFFKEIFQAPEIPAYLSKYKKLVIKPVDSRGSRGVLMLDEKSDLVKAFAYARANSPSERVMIEEFLDGQQISSEGLIVNGIGYIPGLSDRNYEYLERYAPHIIENGGDLPSHLPPEAITELKEVTGRAASALGIMDGPVKGDLIWHNNEAYVIEIAARHSGGYLATHELPWNTGVDLLAQSYALATGGNPDIEALVPRQNIAICQRYIFAEPGRIKAIEGVEEALNIPGVEYVEIRVKAGDWIKPVTDHAARPGLIMTSGASRKEARRVMAEAIGKIRIITETD